MKRLFLTVWCFGMWLNGGVAQTSTDPNEGTDVADNGGGFFTFSYWALTENLYYIQYSTDGGATWLYLPYVLLGNPAGNGAYYFESLVIGPGATFTMGGGGLKSYQKQILPIPTNVLMRLELQPVTVPKDSDGDNVLDYLEILNHLDPDSNTDSDGDGLPDDWERLWFSGSLDQTGSGNPDGDALTTAQELLLGTNPNSNNGTAASLKQLSYDAVGHLQTAGTSTYGYDAEGNIQTSNP